MTTDMRPRLVGYFHMYPPAHNAGAEWMAHAIISRLQRNHGWNVKVLTARPPRRNSAWQGVPVEMVRDPRRLSKEFAWADVAVTHLDVTRTAVGQARRAKTPLAHIVHNDRQLDYHRVTNEKPNALVIFNSQWISEASSWRGKSCVVRPPVWCDDYTVEATGDAVTLINLYWPKGTQVFYELARRMRDVKFIGVRGSYGQQDEAPRDLTNVEIMANTSDIRTVLRRTRVLLMPSIYESWGRVAIEAAAAGIPTVASPTPGLKETGVPVAFAVVEPEPDLDEWEAAVRRLLNSGTTYEIASRRARAQALELEHRSYVELAHLDRTLRKVAGL